MGSPEKPPAGNASQLRELPGFEVEMLPGLPEKL